MQKHTLEIFIWMFCHSVSLVFAILSTYAVKCSRLLFWYGCTNKFLFQSRWDFKNVLRGKTTTDWTAGVWSNSLISHWLPWGWCNHQSDLWGTINHCADVNEWPKWMKWLYELQQSCLLFKTHCNKWTITEQQSNSDGKMTHFMSFCCNENYSKTDVKRNKNWKVTFNIDYRLRCHQQFKMGVPNIPEH